MLLTQYFLGVCLSVCMCVCVYYYILFLWRTQTKILTSHNYMIDTVGCPPTSSPETPDSPLRIGPASHSEDLQCQYSAFQLPIQSTGVQPKLCHVDLMETLPRATGKGFLSQKRSPPRRKWLPLTLWSIASAWCQKPQQ